MRKKSNWKVTVVFLVLLLFVAVVKAQSNQAADQTGNGIPSWTWLLILAAIIVAFFVARDLLKKKEPSAPAAPGPQSPAVASIDDYISKKRKSTEEIRKFSSEKNNLIVQGDTKKGFLARLKQIQAQDIANLFLDSAKKIEGDEHNNVVKLLRNEKELILQFRELAKFEGELRILISSGSWFEKLTSGLSPDLKLRANDILSRLVNIISSNESSNPQDESKGILWLAAMLFNLEKKEDVLLKNLEQIFDEKHISELVKNRFKEAVVTEEKLEIYNNSEKRMIVILLGKLQSQIDLLENLKRFIQNIAPRVRPTRPTPTRHREWEKKEGKYDPIPPIEPVLPIQPVIPRPPEPQPTKFVDYYIDLSPWFMPIKNQEGTSGCAAFAGASIVEFYRNYKRDLKENNVQLGEDLSELFLWYNFRLDKNDNKGVYTFLITDVFEAMKKYGICFDGIWPWEPVIEGIPTKFAMLPRDEAFADALAPFGGLNKKIEGWMELNPGSPDEWVDQLKLGNPIFIAISCDNEFKAAGKRKESLYYNFIGNGSRGHAIVIVAFTTTFPDPRNPENTISAFKIRNSWGKNWGEEGYIWIPYNLLPQMLIAKPYVFLWEKIKKQPEKIQANILTLKPKNSSPDLEIQIIGEQHVISETEGATDLSRILKIGKIDGEARKSHIVLKDTNVSVTEEPLVMIGFYPNYQDKRNVFKIFYGQSTEPKTLVEIEDMEGTKRTVLNFDYLTENDASIRINEYSFDLDIKQEEIEPFEDYFVRFKDKILRLDTTGIKVNIIDFDEKDVKYLIVDDAKKFSRYKINFFLFREKGIRPIALSEKAEVSPNQESSKNLGATLSKVKNLGDYKLIIRAVPLMENKPVKNMKFYGVLDIKPTLLEIKSFDGETLIFTINHQYNKFSHFSVDLFIRKKAGNKFIKIAGKSSYEPNQFSVFQLASVKEFGELGYSEYELALVATALVDGKKSRKIYTSKLIAPLKQIETPSRKETNVFYIGQSVLNLEAKTNIYTQSCTYLWRVEQKDNFQTIGQGSRLAYSEPLSDSFAEGPAVLRLTVFDEKQNVNSISGDKIDIHLLRGGVPAVRPAEREPVMDFEIGVDLTKGKRKDMEDTYSVRKNFNRRNGWLFAAVYDGHSDKDVLGGKYAAEIASKSLDSIFIDELEQTKNIAAAFKNSYKIISKHIRNETDGGTTAANLFIAGWSCVFAHAGDTRIILYRDESMIKETLDHNENNPAERDRVESEDGVFFRGRLNGMLQVTRALGDEGVGSGLSDEPEVERVDISTPLSQGTVRIVLCSDGVFKKSGLPQTVLDEAEIGKIITSYPNSSVAAQAIVEEAIARGATDNITAIVIKIIPKNPLTKNAETEKSVINASVDNLIEIEPNIEVPEDNFTLEWFALGANSLLIPLGITKKGKIKFSPNEKRNMAAGGKYEIYAYLTVNGERTQKPFFITRLELF